MSPEAVFLAIREAKLAESEFKVIVPEFDKAPFTVTLPVLAIVSDPPLLTVKYGMSRVSEHVCDPVIVYKLVTLILLNPKSIVIQLL